MFEPVMFWFKSRLQQKSQRVSNQQNNTGRSPVRAEGPAGCGHSKIARVCAYYLYVVAAAD